MMPQASSPTDQPAGPTFSYVVSEEMLRKEMRITEIVQVLCVG